MPIGITVSDSRELKAVLLAIRSVPREIRAQIRKHTRAMAQPEWQKGLESRAVSRMDQKVLVKTARVQVRDTNVVLRSGATGKLKPITKAVEFGADRNKVESYRSRRGGKTFNVTRHTARQLAWRRPKGRVVYPTAKSMIPRFASLWTQTVIKTIYEAIEKR